MIYNKAVEHKFYFVILVHQKPYRISHASLVDFIAFSCKVLLKKKQHLNNK